MNVKNLSAKRGNVRKPYNKPSKANRNKQQLTPSQRAGRKFRTLSRRSALNYKAKGMNPALSNRMGRAAAGMIAQSTHGLGVGRPNRGTN